MAEPGGMRALENSGNYTTERGGNDRAEMGWKLTTEPGWIKNGIRTEKTGRKCSQRDYPHKQLWRACIFTSQFHKIINKIDRRSIVKFDYFIYK